MKRDFGQFESILLNNEKSLFNMKQKGIFDTMVVILFNNFFCF